MKYSTAIENIQQGMANFKREVSSFIADDTQTVFLQGNR
jgi:hypothetical protein